MDIIFCKAHTKNYELVFLTYLIESIMFQSNQIDKKNIENVFFRFHFKLKKTDWHKKNYIKVKINVCILKKIQRVQT